MIMTCIDAIREVFQNKGKVLTTNEATDRIYQNILTNHGNQLLYQYI